MTAARRGTRTLLAALRESGGAAAPRTRSARLRVLLEAELTRGGDELAKTRSGYGGPVVAAVAGDAGTLLAVLPVAEALRADPGAVDERGWLMVAATVGALVAVAEPGAPGASADLLLRAGRRGERLALSLPVRHAATLVELVPVAFEEEIELVDRLRAQALVVPVHLLEDIDDLRGPIGPTHPLRVAETVARLGGRPADEASVSEHEDVVLALLAPPGPAARPHDDPEPARRVARRILQRLAGMGKWGGYHTEFAHLTRGFAGHDKARAAAVGEALLAAGLLVEKRSVGQSHAFLNSRRAGEINALIEQGRIPVGLRLSDGA
jgi:hypothetical protein